MKLLSAVALTVALAIAPGLAAAKDTKNCDLAGKLAETIMKQRQNGRDMAEMMTMAEEFAPLQGLWRALVIEAYGKPRFSTHEYQERAAQDFKNTVYLACYK